MITHRQIVERLDLLEAMLRSLNAKDLRGLEAENRLLRQMCAAHGLIPKQGT